MGNNQFKILHNMKKEIFKFLSGLIGGMFITMNGHGQDTSLFEKKVFVSEKGDSLQYRILFPEDDDKNKDYPLVLFLHGSGERGNDNEKQLTNGAHLFLTTENRKNHPAIVIFPQCPKDKYWIDIGIREKLRGKGEPDFVESIKSPAEVLATVHELMDQTIQTKQVNKKQVYVMGLSMGGFGTFETLARWPETYAAAVAICGGGNIALTKNYAANTAIWITHGTKDEVVPVMLSQRIYHALKEQGAEVRYTEFPKANHNAWDPTFAIPELLPWLFSHSK
jgi:predicted peptidase